MNILPASAQDFPRYRAIAEHGLLIEFGNTIDENIHARVMQLDAVLQAEPFAGFIEAVPAYASLTIRFDPLTTDHPAAQQAVEQLLSRGGRIAGTKSEREVAVCYDTELAPDLLAVAEATGLTVEEVIAAHLSGDYRVFMYGFAPGYAYMAGVPETVHLPRKAAAVRGVPAGSVLIAGQQCLVTTLTMPTGWWIIGRSPTCVLTGDSERPFLFDVGDNVRFRRISRAQFDAETKP